ncbi:glycine zipper family protein [Cyanothece sp. BG0011]|uniref:glycine zipper family protein n=1 Tax=Cyanothece sp. BG0011 TaxID=2082950 RepID=UPI000D1F45C9|nr:glycine zipper family protein [Cyanothece sp. BG0011]
MSKSWKNLLTISTIVIADLILVSTNLTLAQYSSRSQSYCESYARDFADRYAQSGFFRGGARGAASGAAIGAIVDGGRGAGTGAAIGSVVGIIGGSARRASDHDSLYQQAFNDCMRGAPLR